VGAETAEFLCEQGNHVTLVDMLSQAAPSAPKKVRTRLVSHLEALGVCFVLNSRVLKINRDGIEYTQDGVTKQLTGYDAMILAFGAKANTELYEQMDGLGIEAYRIGDALAAGDAKKAIYEATQLALGL